MNDVLNIKRDRDGKEVQLRRDPKTIHIVVATPAYGGQCMTAFAHSVMALQDIARQTGMGWNFMTINNESLVQRARNTIAADFLATSGTHLLFIDADIGFDALDVIRLLDAQKPVVAGVYPKKSIDWQRVSFAAARGESDLQEYSAMYNLNFEFAKVDGKDVIEAEDHLIKVKDAATGFLLIERAVFERMIEAYPDIAYTANVNQREGQTHHAFFDCWIDPVTKTYLSEDWAFCRRCQEMGIPIWVDSRIRLSHSGTYVFDGAPLSRWLDFYAEAVPVVPEVKDPANDAQPATGT